jgi:hypothetical protein
MKRILIILLLSISLAGYSQSRLQLNPITGDLELSANIAFMADTLINLGDNSPGQFLVNSLIGHNNSSVSKNSMIIGFNCSANCADNFVMGSYFKCSSDHGFAISGGSMEVSQTFNQHGRIPGSVGIGYFSQRGAMHVHSGYNSDDTYCGDIGGVLINRYWTFKSYINRYQYYADSALALSVYSHNVDGSSYMMKLKDSEGVEKFSINDQGATTVAGSFEAGSVISNYTPMVYHAAGDTSYIPVPVKLGDLYIDTSQKDVYISNNTARGGWQKVNE